MWGWLTAFIRGVLEPLIASWQQYQHGRAAQQRDDLRAEAITQEEIRRVQDRDRQFRAARECAVLDVLRRDAASLQAPLGRGPETR